MNAAFAAAKLMSCGYPFQLPCGGALIFGIRLMAILEHTRWGSIHLPTLRKAFSVVQFSDLWSTLSLAGQLALIWVYWQLFLPVPYFWLVCWFQKKTDFNETKFGADSDKRTNWLQFEHCLDVLFCFSVTALYLGRFKAGLTPQDNWADLRSDSPSWQWGGVISRSSYVADTEPQ